MIDPMTAVAAVLAGTSAYSIGAWRYNLHWKRVWRTHAEEALGLAAQWKDRAINSEDRLRTIERQRHNSAKHARAAQLAKAKALRDAKTSELRRDLQASLAEDRLAA